MSERKLKILIIPGVIPFPPDDGGKICIYGFIDYLRYKHDFHIYLPVRSSEQLDIIDKYKIKWPEVIFHNVLLYNPVQEEIVSNKPYKKPSFFRRANNFVKRVIKSILQERKIEAMPLVANEYNLLDDVYKTTPFFPLPEKYVVQLSKCLNTIAFDIVQVELIEIINIVTVIPKGPKKVFVLLEFRNGVLKDYCISKALPKSFTDYVSLNTKSIEYTFLNKYDAVFTLNQTDCDEIESELKDVQVFNSPFPVLDEHLLDVNENAFEPNKLIFMGGENHFPNLDAMTWFVNEVISLINFSTNLKLYITGVWKKETIEKFISLNTNIVFTGFVEDLGPYLKNSIAISPIRLGGGGIRTKIIYAMAAGVPVITTSLACVGVKGIDGRDYIVADNAVDFASAVKLLLTDRLLSQNLSRNGQQIVREFYSQAYLGEKRNRYYTTLTTNN